MFMSRNMFWGIEQLYLLEGEWGGGNGGSAAKGEKQKRGAGKAGDQVSEQSR